VADQGLALPAVYLSSWQHHEQEGRLQTEKVVSQSPQHTLHLPPLHTWSGCPTQAATAENTTSVGTEEPQLHLAHLQQQKCKVYDKFSYFTSLQLEEHLKP